MDLIIYIRLYMYTFGIALISYIHLQAEMLFCILRTLDNVYMHFARDVYLSDFAFRRKISTNFQIADTYQGRIYASLHKHILFHLHRTLLYISRDV